MKVTPIDRSGLISLLPGFLFFTTALIASSKALAGVRYYFDTALDDLILLLQIPIPVYVSVLNSVPAGVYLIDRIFPAGAQVGSSNM